MTRKISVGLIVDVPDDVAEGGHEHLHRYIEGGLAGLDAHIRYMEDVTDEVVARVQGKRRPVTWRSPGDPDLTIWDFTVPGAREEYARRKEQYEAWKRGEIP